MDFPPLLEGLFPQTLVERLGQVNAGVNYAGPRLSALGLPWAAGPWGWVLFLLAMETLPVGLLGPTGAILALPDLERTGVL